MIALLTPLNVFAQSPVVESTALATPVQPLERIGQIGGVPYAVDVAGTYAYLQEGPRLVILDISDLTRIQVVGKTPPLFVKYSDYDPIDIAADPVRKLVYVSERDKGLHIIDIADQKQPKEVGLFTDPPLYSNQITAAGNYVYRADASYGLTIVDVTNPTKPVLAGYIDTTNAKAVRISGSYAYVADGAGGFQVIYIGTPGRPVLVETLTVTDARDVDIQDSYAYVADYPYHVRIFDISNPASPVQVKDFLDYGMEPKHLHAMGTKLFIDVNRILDITDPTNPTLYKNSLGFSYGNHWAFFDSKVAVVNRKLSIYDLAQNSAPVLSGQYSPINYEPNGVRIVGSTAYVGDGETIHVLDISKPEQAREVGLIPVLNERFEISGNYIYAIDYMTLRVVDISNLASPILITSITFPTETNSLAVAANRIYISCDDALRIYDITNPKDLRALGSITYPTPSGRWSTRVFGGYVYLTEWEKGVHIIDARNPAAPLEVTLVPTPDWPYDTAVLGNYAYIAASTAGVRVLDISNPAAAKEVGFIDQPDWCGVKSVTVLGNRLFVADNQYKVAVLDLAQPTQPIEVARYTNQNVDGYSTVQAWGNFLVSTTLSAGVEFYWYGPWTYASLPAVGGSVTSSFDQTRYTIPAGVFNQAINFTHTPRYPGTLPRTGALRPAGPAFTWKATGSNGETVTPVSPVTLTVHLGSGSAQPGGQPALYHWNGSTWVIMESQYNAAAHTLTLQTKETGLWATFESSQKVFLPLMQK